MLKGYKKIWYAYVKKSKRKNREFTLSPEEFIEIILSNCFYCGRLPSNNLYKGKERRSFNYSGIDRVNNDLGYIKSNCVPCCSSCNSAKGIKPVEEFYSWVEDVYINSVLNNT